MNALPSPAIRETPAKVSHRTSAGQWQRLIRATTHGTAAPRTIAHRSLSESVGVETGAPSGLAAAATADGSAAGRYFWATTHGWHCWDELPIVCPPTQQI